MQSVAWSIIDPHEHSSERTSVFLYSLFVDFIDFYTDSSTVARQPGRNESATSGVGKSNDPPSSDDDQIYDDTDNSNNDNNNDNNKSNSNDNNDNERSSRKSDGNGSDEKENSDSEGPTYLYKKVALKPAGPPPEIPAWPPKVSFRSKSRA